MASSYLDQIDPLASRTSALDRLSQGQQVDPSESEAIDRAALNSMGEFEKGLRRFGYSALATSEAFAGQMAETISPEFTKNRMAGALETMREMPNTLRPQYETFEDAQQAGGVGDYAKYAAGALGEGLGSVGLMTAAGLLTRGASLRAAPATARAAQFAGGAAAMLPMEGGETALSLRENPEAMANTTAAERTAMTLGRGTVNAALENIVPNALFTNQIAGLGKTIAPGLRSAMGNIARKSAAGVVGEAGTEGAQDLTGQFVMNQAVPGTGYDLEPTKEAAIRGAITGGVLGGAGATAQGLYSNARAGGEKLADEARVRGPRALDAAVSTIYDVVNNPASVGEDIANMTMGAVAEAKTQIPEYAELAKEQLSKGVDIASEAIADAENEFSRFILNNVTPENQAKYASLRTDLKNMTVNEYRAMRDMLQEDTQGNAPYLAVGRVGRNAKKGAQKFANWTKEIYQGAARAIREPKEGEAQQRSLDLPQYDDAQMDELAKVFAIAHPELEKQLAELAPGDRQTITKFLIGTALEPSQVPKAAQNELLKITGEKRFDKLQRRLNRLHALYQANPNARAQMADIFEENQVPTSERMGLIELAGRDTPYEELDRTEKAQLTKLAGRANEATQAMMAPLLVGKPLDQLTADDRVALNRALKGTTEMSRQERGRAYYEGVVRDRLTRSLNEGIRPEYVPPGAPQMGTGANTNRIMTNQELYDLEAGKERYFDDDTGEWAVRDLQEFNRSTPWDDDFLRQALRADALEIAPDDWANLKPDDWKKKVTTNKRTGEQMQNSVPVELYSDTLPPEALAELIGTKPNTKHNKIRKLTKKEIAERTEGGTFTTYINLESVGKIARNPKNAERFDPFLPEWSRDSATNQRSKAESMANKAMAALANLSANGLEIDPATLSSEFKKKYGLEKITDPISVYAAIDMEPLTGENTNVLAGTRTASNKTKRLTFPELAGTDYGASSAQQLRTLRLFEGNLEELKEIAALPVQSSKGLKGKALQTVLASNRQRISAQKLVNRLEGIQYGEGVSEPEAAEILMKALEESETKQASGAVRNRVYEDAEILAEAAIDDGVLPEKLADFEGINDAEQNIDDITLIKEWLETDINVAELVNMAPYDIDKPDGARELDQLAAQIAENILYRREREAETAVIQTGAMEEETTDWTGAANDFMNSLEMAERRLRESLARPVEAQGRRVADEKAQVQADMEAYMEDFNKKAQAAYAKELYGRSNKAASIPELRQLLKAVDKYNKTISEANWKNTDRISRPLISKETRTRFEKRVRRLIKHRQGKIESTIRDRIDKAKTTEDMDKIKRVMKARLGEIPAKKATEVRKLWKETYEDIADPAGRAERAEQRIIAKLTPAQRQFRRIIEKTLGKRVAVLFDQNLGTGVSASYSSADRSAETLEEERTAIIKFVRTPVDERDPEAFEGQTDEELLAYADVLEEMANAKRNDEAVQGIIRVASGMEQKAGVAEHEALHGAFRLLFAHRKEDRRILTTAFTTGLAGRRLREYFKDAPEVLERIDPNSEKFNAEEAAAYGYQVWATDPAALRLGEKQQGIFEKIKALFRAVFKILTPEEKALMLMRELRDGKTAESGITALQRYQDRDRTLRDHIVDVPKALHNAVSYFTDRLLRSTYSRMMDTDNPALAQIARLGYIATGEESGDRGTGMVQRQRMETTSRLNKLGGIFKSLGGDEQIQAMHEQHIANPEGREQDAIDAYLQELRQYQVEAGVDLNDAGPTYYPLPWDPEKVLNNQQAFLDMLNKYRDQLETDLAITPMEIWDNIAQYGERGETLTDVTGQNAEPVASHTKTRYLAFLSPEDRRPFMPDSPEEVLTHYTQQAVRNAEFVRAYGNNGSTFNKLMAEAKDVYGASQEELALAQEYLDGLLNNKGQGMSRELKDAYGALTLYQNVRLLPFSAFSSLVDPLGIAVRTGDGRAAFEAFTYSMKNLFRDWRKEYTPDQWEQIATDQGYIEASGTPISTDARYTGITLTGKTRKWNDTFFKMNLLNGLVRNHHIMATKAADKFLLRASENFFGEEQSARYLDEVGVRATDVIYSEALQRNLISQQEFEDAGFEPEEAAQMAERIRQGMGTIVRQSLISPSSAEMPAWMSNPYLAPIAHLKSFVFGFNKTIIERLTHEARNGNSRPLLYAAAYVPGMIAADFAKDMVSNMGDEPPYKKDWGMADYLQQGVYRSGLTGVGQFFTDAGNDMSRGGYGIESFLGPSVEQGRDWYRAFQTGSGERFWTETVDALPANAMYDQWLDP